MKHILAPTDFSNDAYNALYFATQLLKRENCTFYLLNSFNEKTPLLSKKAETKKGKEQMYALHAESKEGLLRMKHRITLDTGFKNHVFETLSLEGDLTETLDKLVKELHIDLVVMGNKGVTGAKDLFMGSNTTRAINVGLACPILTIPKEIDFKLPKHLALVTDYKKCIGADQISVILDIAKLSGATVRVMHINEKERLDKFETSNMNTLSHYLEGVDHSFHWMPKFASKTAVIQSFLEEIEIDFLVMFNTQHSVLEKIFREPVIKKVAFDIELPFLVVNAS
ncbi:universal stress protein [Sediminicola sp. 1XM1-17]|uniref:universal stress protein n=1 Tax=Sediminicola sp. 1XM1-17 TaxID=3127702 RepID=UPI0030783689